MIMNNYKMENIRNVAVMGHGKCGKSSIIEAMLFNSGAINRIGKNADGTLTFTTDRFSNYALAYEDVANTVAQPNYLKLIVHIKQKKLRIFPFHIHRHLLPWPLIN